MKKINKNFILILYRILAVFAVFILILLAFNIRNSKYTFNDFSNGWVDDTGNIVNISRISKDIKLYKQLDKIEYSTKLYISVKSLKVNIYINDRLIYNSEDDQVKYAGKTSGTEFIYVDLDSTDSYQTLCLEVTNPYGRGFGKITDVKIDDGYELLKNNLSRKFLSSSLCIIISFIGLLILVVYIPLSQKKIVGKELVYLGVFAISIGLFMFTDSKILQLLFGNEYIFHTIAEVFMSLLVVPLILYINEIYNKKNNIVSYLICLFSIIISIISLILNLFGILDLHETVIFTHVSYIFSIIYIVYAIIISLKNKNINRLHFISMLVLVIGALTDIIVIYCCSITETSEFTRIGTVIFLVMEISAILMDSLKKIKNDFETQLLSDLAYHDGLTKLLNRTSFIEDMEKIDIDKNSANIIMFDVNNLKKVNDKYGHTEGDYLLTTSANVIKNTFDNIGKIYRIGGDEFVVITFSNINEDDIVKKLKEMNKNLKKLNNSIDKPYIISIASGYALKDNNKIMKDLFNIADHNMYENKIKMKKEMKSK